MATQHALGHGHQRGIRTVPDKGAAMGRHRACQKAGSIDQVADLKSRVAAGQPKIQAARDFGISRETLYQYLRAYGSQ